MLYDHSPSSLMKFTHNHLHSFVGITNSNCPSEEVVLQLD